MEGGGAATQGGVGYQDQVAALYMGRMLDQRPRPPKDRPESVRVEATSAVDDALVEMADGRRLFIQAKRALATCGDAWTGMWKAFANQATTDFRPGDSLSLAIGETTTVATRLREICTRSNEPDVLEWHQRLSEPQRRLAVAIAAALGGDDALALHVCRQLDVDIWPAEGLVRDYAPLWMPACDQSPDQLHAVLTGIALEGAATRQRFAPAELYDRLRADWDIRIESPESWGAARYRGAIARSAVVTLPGTGFSRPIGDDFLWPRCLPYDRGRKPDFDDDAPRWREVGDSAAETLRNFPGADLDSVVLIAGPGFGKSTLVQAIAARLANDGLLPAIIRIPELADAGSGIAEFLANEVNTAFGVGIDWAAAAGAGTLVLLLDGLDEVSGSRRTAVLQKLSDYRASSPQVRWLMTVRDPAALAMPEGARVLELAPLSDEEIDRYVEFYRPGEPALPALIRERLRGRPDLNRLVRIPIFLALMLVLRQEERNISRSDLLETYLEVLFNPKDYKASQDEAVDPTTLRNIAERAAFEALEDCLQLMAGRADGIIVVGERQPCLLLALAGQRQVKHGHPVDLLLGIERANARQQIAEREDTPDRQIGQAERVGDIADRATFANQPGERLPLRRLVGIEPRHVLDQRRLDRVGIVARIEDRAGQRFAVAAIRPALISDDGGGGEAARARDDLETAGRAILAYDHRLYHAALADAGQDIADVRGLAPMAHIGPAHGQSVERNEVEFHDTVPSIRAGRARFRSRGRTGPVCGRDAPARQPTALRRSEARRGRRHPRPAHQRRRRDGATATSRRHGSQRSPRGRSHARAARRSPGRLRHR